MKILYIPCHSILEYDEVKLFTELGHDVFSMDSYRNPSSPIDPLRPPIEGIQYHDDLNAITSQCSRENIHPALIEWADVIMVMHKHEWVILNWEKMKHKKVVWRTIGQSIPDVESLLALPRSEGLKIVRYSPAEQGIPGYIGHDAIIRFYKDEDEYSCWTGQIPAVLTISQSMKQRNKFCGYDIFSDVTRGLSRVLYGRPSRNPDGSLMDDLLWNGQLSFEEIKATYRHHRVYFYTGTYPASYTLNFIEAMMTGIPIVAIGEKLANLSLWKMKTYEIHQIIKHRENGFCSDDLSELQGNLEYMMAHSDEAKRIGEAGRKTAMELFGKKVIKPQWEEFFKSL